METKVADIGEINWLENVDNRRQQGKITKGIFQELAGWLISKMNVERTSIIDNSKGSFTIKG